MDSSKLTINTLLEAQAKLPDIPYVEIWTSRHFPPDMCRMRALCRTAKTYEIYLVGSRALARLEQDHAASFRMDTPNIYSSVLGVPVIYIDEEQDAKS